MIDMVATGCLAVLIASIGLNIARIVIGPSNADRVVAADVVIMNLIALVVIYSIIIKTTYYFDLVLVFSLLGFIGTVTFAKFLGRGRIIK
jgi:multisubunit Na+/H+ antiporter MnhF subunit